MKFNFSKKQKIIGLVLVGLLLIVVILALLLKNKNAGSQLTNPGSTILKPVFLDNKEKTDLNIKPENKVQVIQRNAEGKIILYKVIKNDNDIITDLNQIKAENPDFKK
ncbi:MAG: hypothetical protein ACYC40_00725 [Patescibacteria group bacterium]